MLFASHRQTSAPVGGVYSQRSLYLDGPAGQMLTRTFSPAPTSLQKMTIFIRFKIDAATGVVHLLSQYSGPSAYGWLAVLGSGKLFFQMDNDGTTVKGGFQTTATVAPGVWHWLWVGIDTTLAVADDRLQVVLDGSVPALDFKSAPPLNYASEWLNTNRLHKINTVDDVAGLGASTLQGPVDEFAFVDGALVPASAFAGPSGETLDLSVTIPAWGVNGCWLDFEDPTSVASLLADRSGNGNNWSGVNLTTGNSSLDVG